MWACEQKQKNKVQSSNKQFDLENFLMSLIGHLVLIAVMVT